MADSVGGSTENAKVLVADMAGRQWGRVSRVQVEAGGVSKGAFAAWITDGYHRAKHSPAVQVIDGCPSTRPAALQAGLA